MEGFLQLHLPVGLGEHPGQGKVGPEGSSLQRCGRRNLVAPAGLGAGGKQWGHAEPGGGGAAAQTHGLSPAC